MIAKKVPAWLLALLVAWGATGCILLAKPAVDKVRGTDSAESDEEEKKKKQ